VRRIVLACVVALGTLLGCSGTATTSSFCTTVRAGENPLDVFDRYDPSDVAGAHATLAKGVNRLKQLEASAPEELRPSLTTLTVVAQELITTLDARVPNPSSAPTTDFASKLDEVSKASATVTQFAAERCGVLLDPTATTVPSTTPTPTS
jgi:hypothetical protein